MAIGPSSSPDRMQAEVCQSSRHQHQHSRHLQPARRHFFDSATQDEPSDALLLPVRCFTRHYPVPPKRRLLLRRPARPTLDAPPQAVRRAFCAHLCLGNTRLGRAPLFGPHDAHRKPNIGGGIYRHCACRERERAVTGIGEKSRIHISMRAGPVLAREGIASF
jgi:hypothetical protein